MKLYWPGRCRRCGAPTKGSPDSWYCLGCFPAVQAERERARQEDPYLLRYVASRWGFENRPTWNPKAKDLRRDFGPSDWEIAYPAERPVERPEPSPAERLLGGLYLALLERCEDGDARAQELERELEQALREGDASLAEQVAGEIRRLLGD